MQSAVSSLDVKKNDRINQQKKLEHVQRISSMVKIGRLVIVLSGKRWAETQMLETAHWSCEINVAFFKNPFP